MRLLRKLLGDSNRFVFLILAVSLIACQASLHELARDGDLDEVIRAIDTHRANVNAIDACGWSALHVATYYLQLPVVDGLLDRKANVNAQTTSYSAACMGFSHIPAGSTPLIIAAYYGAEDIVAMLLARGADVRIKNADGYTAIGYAREFEFRSVANILAKAAKEASP
jgi:ankyrin repeat protein